MPAIGDIIEIPLKDSAGNYVITGSATGGVACDIIPLTVLTNELIPYAELTVLAMKIKGNLHTNNAGEANGYFKVLTPKIDKKTELTLVDQYFQLDPDGGGYYVSYNDSIMTITDNGVSEVAREQMQKSSVFSCSVLARQVSDFTAMNTVHGSVQVSLVARIDGLK
jgi:hypothetical protein